MLTEPEEEIRITQTRKWGTPPMRLSLGMSREGWRCTRKVFSYFSEVFRPTNNRGSLHWRFQRSTLAPSGVSAKCTPPFRPAGKKKHNPQVIFIHTTFRASVPFKQKFTLLHCRSARISWDTLVEPAWLWYLLRYEIEKRQSGLGIPSLVCPSVRRICSLQEKSNQPFSSNTSLFIFQKLQRFLFS